MLSSAPSLRSTDWLICETNGINWSTSIALPMRACLNMLVTTCTALPWIALARSISCSNATLALDAGVVIARLAATGAGGGGAAAGAASTSSPFSVSITTWATALFASA